MAGAAVSSEEAFDDLSGRSRAATAFLEFAPGRFHRRDQFLAPMFRQPVLENFHERFLFFHGQIAGGIQNLRKLCHGWNLPSGRPLGNHVFLHLDESFAERVSISRS
jgi:hypothetical protein